MTTKFLVGAFAILIIISLVIVGIIRGFNLGKTGSTKPVNKTVPLPVVSNDTSTPSAIPQPVETAIGNKTYNQSDLNISLAYPQKFTVNASKVGPSNNFPYLAYELIFTSGPSTSGFGVFMAPHNAGQSLTDILNEQNNIAAQNGDTPATFVSYNKIGNSLETAKFTGGSPSLYAVRTTNNVYYLYQLPSSGAEVIDLDSIINTLQFGDAPGSTRAS